MRVVFTFPTRRRAAHQAGPAMISHRVYLTPLTFSRPLLCFACLYSVSKGFACLAAGMAIR